MAKLRTLIVEDSLTMRQHLVAVLSADPDIEIVGETGDGKQAIDLCLQLQPDVITLDIVLPTMSGLAVTEYIMAYRPTPILIVSSSSNRGDLFKTYEALAAGAVDVLEKPRGDECGDSWERGFLAALKMVSRIKVITHPRLRLGGLGQRPAGPNGAATGAATGAVMETAVDAATGPDRKAALVVIGASTGGPAAVLDILRGLPPDFPLPILIVIHIGELFAAAFAEWLDSHAPIRVRYAVDGEPLPARGQSLAVIAPPGRHLVVAGGRLRLTTEGERHSCRPSVDVLFESVAREAGPRTIACLLTGMGRDGALGLQAIRQAGGTTLAQDEATSVVFGMPQEALRLGAVQSMLPLNAFAPTLIGLAGHPGRAAAEPTPTRGPR